MLARPKLLASVYSMSTYADHPHLAASGQRHVYLTLVSVSVALAREHTVLHAPAVDAWVLKQKLNVPEYLYHFSTTIPHKHPPDPPLLDAPAGCF
jgi:hypothetical protein